MHGTEMRLFEDKALPLFLKLMCASDIAKIGTSFDVFSGLGRASNTSPYQRRANTLRVRPRTQVIYISILTC